MPQHSLRGSNAFKFDLAAPAGWPYAPGETIIGNLMRKTPIVTPKATVSLSLEGRSKVKIVRSSGQSRKVYRDHWQIIRLRESVIYKGPLHLPEGSDEALSWPISLDIPLEPIELSSGYDTKGSFLPKDMSHPIHHTLPGSFFSTETSVFGSTTGSCSFVEYFLTAYLRYQHGGHNEMHEAVCPIIMRHSMPDTHRLGVPQMFTARNKVSSQRLLPGMEKAELSFKQHTQKFFGSSEVPQFAYTLRLTMPASIRLDDSSPIPLQIEVVQNPESTSDSIKDVAQNIEISELQAILRSQTVDRALSTVFNIEVNNGYDEKACLGLQNVLSKLESPLVITTGKRSESLHLGNMLQLTLGSRGLRCQGQIVRGAYTSCSIHPDLTTHNIRHTHRMEWKIGLKIAGETETHRFTNGVQIIGSA